jgi:hypothetical protein
MLHVELANHQKQGHTPANENGAENRMQQADIVNGTLVELTNSSRIA